MKLAIHHIENSFSERWIKYCKENAVEYKIVNCFDNNIIQELEDCDALLWNWSLGDYKTRKFAKQLTYSLEKLGKVVFPNSSTSWHYDDKVGQKYLLEAIKAPFISTFIFYDKKSALAWAKNTSYPKVFKLSTGAGASNVKLINNKEDAYKLINIAFKYGFSPVNRLVLMQDKYKLFKRTKTLSSFYTFAKSIGRLFIKTELENLSCRESGYVYFQEFIPNNSFDLRIVTAGNKAFGIKRYCRENDFRASGSGIIDYSKNSIDERCVKISLDISKKLGAQSLAYDFVFDTENHPLIVEISYDYTMKAYDKCEGYWDSELKWHSGSINPQQWMIEDVIQDII